MAIYIRILKSHCLSVKEHIYRIDVHGDRCNHIQYILIIINYGVTNRSTPFINISGEQNRGYCKNSDYRQNLARIRFAIAHKLERNSTQKKEKLKRVWQEYSFAWYIVYENPTNWTTREKKECSVWKLKSKIKWTKHHWAQITKINLWATYFCFHFVNIHFKLMIFNSLNENMKQFFL